MSVFIQACFVLTFCLVWAFVGFAGWHIWKLWKELGRELNR
jgi:hypothetical protein